MSESQDSFAATAQIEGQITSRLSEIPHDELEVPPTLCTSIEIVSLPIAHTFKSASGYRRSQRGLFDCANSRSGENNEHCACFSDRHQHPPHGPSRHRKRSSRHHYRTSSCIILIGEKLPKSSRPHNWTLLPWKYRSSFRVHGEIPHCLCPFKPSCAFSPLWSCAAF